ncbi:tobamovirus multiplication protein 1, partial [Quercus suber]
MSYNDEYMVWFRPRTVRHITKETSYWDTLVESQLRIMAKCEPGSEIYTHCIKALESVEEIGRLTLDDARVAGNTSEPAVGRGRQASGRQGRGGRQSSQRPTSTQRQHPTPVPTSSRRHTPVHDHTMEEASQTVDEMCLDTGYDMGSMARDDAGPSHIFAHGDTSRSPSMRCDDTCPPTSPSTSPLPTTSMFPLLTTSTAPADVHGIDEMRFMPTPGAVPPEFVHSEFSQTQIPAPPPEASHIPDRPQRPQRTQTHPPDCGTGHVFACVLFRQGETSQGTSKEKKTGMIKLYESKVWFVALVFLSTHILHEGFDGFFGFCDVQIQLIRIELRVPEYGWTTHKVFHLMNFIVNGVINLLVTINGQARSLPTDKLRIVYISVNAGIYLVQVCIWVYLWIDDNSIVEFIGKIFIAVVSIIAALGFLLYGGRLFFMLRRFPIESKGRRKKLHE